MIAIDEVRRLALAEAGDTCLAALAVKSDAYARNDQSRCHRLIGDSDFGCVPRPTREQGLSGHARSAVSVDLIDHERCDMQPYQFHRGWTAELARGVSQNSYCAGLAASTFGATGEPVLTSYSMRTSAPSFM